MKKDWADEENKAYAGRWVARIRGKVIAQGGTPYQARIAAQSRFKEVPEVVYSPHSPKLNFPPVLDLIRQALPESVEAFLVGGAIRDALLGLIVNDLDFCVPGDAIKVARHIANSLQSDFYVLDSERDTGRVILKNPGGSRITIDFAAFRRNGDSAASTKSISHLPLDQQLAIDLNYRDFTVNAIAMNLKDTSIFDPLGGGQDLLDKRLRSCSSLAFTDDPVRILRGVRFAAKYGFQIVPETRILMKAASKELIKVSPERLRDELVRILAGPQLASSVRALDILGALPLILSEMGELKGVNQRPPHVHDVWDHTIAIITHLETILDILTPGSDPEKSADLLNGLLVMKLGRYRQQIKEYLEQPLTADRSTRSLLMLAALYHDIAKPVSRQMDENGRLRFWGHDELGATTIMERARHLAFSNDEIQTLGRIVRNHMRILNQVNRSMEQGTNPSRLSVYRFFKDTAEAGVGVALLALADLRASYEQSLPQEMWEAALNVVGLMLENWYEKPTESISPSPLIDGNDLMITLGLEPGKQVGALLEAIREAQAKGEVATREQAIGFVTQRLKMDLHRTKSE